MRKAFWIVLFLALLAVTPALAQTYTFVDVHVTLELPDNVYDVVLTPDTLSMNTSWLEAQGLDYDNYAADMAARGVLMEARDTKNGRLFLLTAVKDVDAKNYFDLNLQDDDMRKQFRTEHSGNEVYKTLGYHYYSAAWKNYGGTLLRFLHTRYSFSVGGTLDHGGYERKTIRNGYTITLDMQTAGREAKEADEKALTKIMNTFKFTEIVQAPELPIKLTVTKEPPLSTNTDTFTVSGKSKPNAKITVTALTVMSSSASITETTANKSGAYSVKVKLPAQGTFTVTVRAEGEGALAAQSEYSVTYQEGLLPVEITSTPSAVLTDKTVISGSTIAGATTQVSVTGPINYQKSTTSKTFNFTIDTSDEGTYNFILLVTKKGLDTQPFTYTGTRALTDQERYDRMTSSAVSPAYNRLTAKDLPYDGRVVGYSGYITSVAQAAEEWVVAFALTKSGDNYKNLIYVITNTEPKFAVGEQVKMYGTLDGTYTVLLEDSGSKSYPRANLLAFEGL